MANGNWFLSKAFVIEEIIAVVPTARILRLMLSWKLSEMVTRMQSMLFYHLWVRKKCHLNFKYNYFFPICSMHFTNYFNDGNVSTKQGSIRIKLRISYMSHISYTEHVLYSASNWRKHA